MALIKTLENAGTRVMSMDELPQHPNSVFTKDTAVCTPAGYIHLKMGLPSRTGEEDWMAGFHDSLLLSYASNSSKFSLKCYLCATEPERMRFSMKFTIWILTMMPFRLFYGISTFVFFTMYYILGYRKEVVCRNLNNAFPEKSKAEISHIRKEFYKHLADYLVETVANFHMKISDFDARYRLTNTELLDKYAREGINVILAPGHYGNWEWVSYLVLKINFTCVAIYKEQSNKFVDDLILHSRGKYGLLLYQYHDAYRYLLNNKDTGPLCLYFAADQRPAKDSKVPWVNFLNQPTAAFRGLDSLHRKTKGVVLYVHIMKVKRGFYEVEFRPLNKPGEVEMVPDLTVRYFEALESNIREDPRFYLWSHNRWKFKPSPEAKLIDEEEPEAK